MKKSGIIALVRVFVLFFLSAIPVGNLLLFIQ
jgi:hypothetical protein